MLSLNIYKSAARACFSAAKSTQSPLLTQSFVRHFHQNSQLLSEQSAVAKHEPETVKAVNTLRDQLRYYAIAEIAGRPFLVTKNDVVVVDHMKEVQLGDILKLNRVRELGSHDYTIQGKPYVNSDFYSIRATVIEQPKGKQIEIIKKKRRKGYQRRLTHRQPYTVLRISEVEVNKLE
ncbi:hypothetical protein K493DRAFT_311509 [Basidiobolus meristosporus CBS 931.73]|uniref:Large ribosomal subunit protein bL21m n=1 Tax=Basidiobolus meristosporus CBS 931.73 TaxID=1314790 RepID=A0A1Y1Z1B4_9FUNG|nr:hypothetical protein K493DRAFT_311509 [Basidiobolus meristosporus CBS 931.73]|eukprot:ORY04083.1 hypothetical protein K493DRAFT_311509 [Basidiobolus meristosporus CBS 931.73]